MATISKHAFGSKEGVETAKQQGKIDAYDVLFLDNGETGWIDKNGETKLSTPRTQTPIVVNGVTGLGIADKQTIPAGKSLEEIVKMLVQKPIPATYTQPSVSITNNGGQASPEGHVMAGSVTSGNYNISGQRNMFYGTGVGKFENADSTKIRALTNKRLNPTAGLKILLKVETGQQYIVFALPAPRTLTQVIYDDLGDKGMLSSFVKSTVQVADARGEQNGLKDYNCYVYNLATPAQAPMNFTFVIG